MTRVIIDRSYEEDTVFTHKAKEGYVYGYIACGTLNILETRGELFSWIRLDNVLRVIETRRYGTLRSMIEQKISEGNAVYQFKCFNEAWEYYKKKCHVDNWSGIGISSQYK